MAVKTRSERFVLITGASSGIGRATAVRLATEGFEVFAGCCKAEDEAALRQASAHIRPIRLDVVDEDAIAEAVNTVRGLVGVHGLHGLVNNAGIGDPGPLEYVPLQDVRRQFDVNVLGPIAVTHAER